MGVAKFGTWHYLWLYRIDMSMFSETALMKVQDSFPVFWSSNDPNRTTFDSGSLLPFRPGSTTPNQATIDSGVARAICPRQHQLLIRLPLTQSTPCHLPQAAPTPNQASMCRPCARLTSCGHYVWRRPLAFANACYPFAEPVICLQCLRKSTTSTRLYRCTMSLRTRNDMSLRMQDLYSPSALQRHALLMV